MTLKELYNIAPMGSGSTCVACIHTNRKYIGIEKDKHYFEVATNRIKECIKELE